MKMEKLGHRFLEKHPEYAHRTKQKQDPKMSTNKVILNGLMDNLPAEYSTNQELQENLKCCFVEYTEAIKEDFNTAGLGDLDQYQVDSVVAGSMMHQYFGKGKFGEGVQQHAECRRM